ncbi:hypothetical protein ACFOGJ_18120 [Marinibaculum pumilum]|uniref:RelA/SpoT domain-containing protein n=1 Tax=Marinibaculum pumilum TaxID=1766165 RepID=A0ABV7L4B1_9PROT
MTNATTLGNPEVSLELALSAAEQVAQRLRTLSNTIGPSYEAVLFYSRIRTKTKESIREKTSRKQKDPKRSPYYSYHDMTDLVGFRAVTLYEAQLLEAMNFVISLVRAGQKLPEQLFNGDSLFLSFREALFFNSPAPSPTSIDHSSDSAKGNVSAYEKCIKELESIIDKDIESYYRRKYLEKQIKKSDSTKLIKKSISDIKELLRFEESDLNTYSSAHLIFDAVGHENGYSIIIPVEFQIRTAIEDIWAEIDHKQLYKLRDEFTWCFEFERYFNRAEGRSSMLRGDIHRLAGMMRRMSSISESAKQHIKKFIDSDEADADDPLLMNGSFGISLFYRAGDNKIDPQIIMKLTEYQRSLGNLTQTPPGSDAAVQVYRECRQKLVDIRNALEKSFSKIKLDLENANKEDLNEEDIAEPMLFQQRIKICDIEIVRLKASAIVEDIYIDESSVVTFRNNLENSVLSPGGVEEYERKREVLCREIYTELCSIIDDGDLKIRPLAMIFFWKHIVSLKFDKSLSEKNILKSYEYLKYDGTVPRWSIYRSIVPHYLASQYYRSVRNTIREFEVKTEESTSKTPIGRTEGLQRMPNLRTELIRKLADTTKLALEAFEAAQDENDRRGDLRMGYKGDDSLRAAELAFSCIACADQELGVELLKPNHVLNERVKKMVKHVNEDVIEGSNMPSARRKYLLEMRSATLSRVQ